MSKKIFFLDRLIEEGGDWDRRNRLKVYQGIYFLSIRDFKLAATNFLDSISTFTSYELMDYKTFVTYTVLASIIALERVNLREQARTYFIVHETQLKRINTVPVVPRQLFPSRLY